MSRSKVTIPLMTFNPSGGVRMIVVLANRLAAEGFAVELCVPDYAAVSPWELHEDIDVSVITAGGPPFAKFRYLGKMIARLSRDEALFIATGYQTPLLIHAGGWLRFKTPRMLSLIQNYEPDSLIRHGRQPRAIKPILRFAAEAGFRLPGYKVAVSHYVAHRVGDSRIDAIVPPGIRDTFFTDSQVRIENPSATVGIFPTPGEVKGTPFVLSAIETLRRDGVAADFLVFDRDYPTDHIPSHIERFSDYASKRGIDVSLPAFYGNCDIFVFPSLVEGFGLPPIEAMASGAAVVLTNSGGVMEYAEDGVNCQVVPPGDAAAISQSVRNLIEDSELREKLVTEGYQTAKAFTEDRFVENCVQIVRSLLTNQDS